MTVLVFIWILLIFQEKFSDALRHPDSPDWYKKEVHEKVKKDLLWAAPYDARFPQVKHYKNFLMEKAELGTHL